MKRIEESYNPATENSCWIVYNAKNEKVCATGNYALALKIYKSLNLFLNENQK